MSRESLNAVECRTALTRLPGKHHHGGERRGPEPERSGVRNNRTILARLDQTELEGADGLDGEKVPLILRHDGPTNGTG
jgi:hypothetical protein